MDEMLATETRSSSESMSPLSSVSRRRKRPRLSLASRPRVRPSDDCREVRISSVSSSPMPYPSATE